MVPDNIESDVTLILGVISTVHWKSSKGHDRARRRISKHNILLFAIKSAGHIVANGVFFSSLSTSTKKARISWPADEICFKFSWRNFSVNSAGGIF